MVNPDTHPGSLALLTRLAKMVYRRSSEEQLGMTMRHFVTMSYLRDHPNAPQQDLGDVFCIDASNLVLLLNELEDADLAERRRDPSDRRRHLVQLTATGEEALERAERAQLKIEAELLQTLSADERATLHHLLARALADVEPSPTPAAVEMSARPAAAVETSPRPASAVEPSAAAPVSAAAS